MSFWDYIIEPDVKDKADTEQWAKSAKWREQMPAAAMTYFNSWVPMATNKKARYSHCVTGGEINFHVFVCSCGSNINIGQNQFSGIGGQITEDCAVPWALQEWVKEHRHVCKEYIPMAEPLAAACDDCGWPKNAHDQPLSKEVVDFANESLTKWQKQMIENHAKLKALKQKELEEKIKAKALEPAESENEWTSYKIGFQSSASKPAVDPAYYSKETVQNLKKNLFITSNKYTGPDYDEPMPVAVPEEIPVVEQPTGRKFRK